MHDTPTLKVRQEQENNEVDVLSHKPKSILLNVSGSHDGRRYQNPTEKPTRIIITDLLTGSRR